MDALTAQRAIRALRREWRGDFADRELVDEKIVLSTFELASLNSQADRFRATHRDISALHRGGHPVAAQHRTMLVQWTCISRIIDVEGRSIFLLYNFPSSWFLRLYFTLKAWRKGVPAFRPMGRHWKRVVENRSIIPAIAWDRTDMVALPYVESVSADDLLAGDAPRSSDAAFVWTADFTKDAYFNLLETAGKMLATLHASGAHWGDPLLLNVIVDAQRRPMLVDMEMTYFGASSKKRQQMDVEMFVQNAHERALECRGWNDRQAIADRIMAGYRAGMPPTS